MIEGKGIVTQVHASLLQSDAIVVDDSGKDRYDTSKCQLAAE